MSASCKYTLQTDGKDKKLVVDCMGCKDKKSISDSENCMGRILKIMLDEPDTDRIILSELIEREYDKPQVDRIKELTKVIEDTRYWPLKKIKPAIKEDCMCVSCLKDRKEKIQNILNDLLFKDPIGAYVMTGILIDREYEVLAKEDSNKCLECRSFYIKNCLNPVQNIFESERFFQKVSANIPKLKPEDRSPYRDMLPYLARPYFSTSRIMLTPPQFLDELEKYTVGDSNINIYKFKDRPEYMYFILPAEYGLDEDKFKLINEARNRLVNHDPGLIDFSDSERVIRYFKRISRRIISETVADSGIPFEREDIDYLSDILAKYSAGMGVVEVILSDEKVTDLYINSPISENPLYIVHRDYGDCMTNVYLTQGDVESLISRFRARSGRAFSEAVPVMDLEIPEYATRVCAIGRPIAPDGTAFALRRAKPTPWTIPQFIENKMINPFTAGLLSFLVDGQTTMLVAGSRGAGKTSLLTAIMTELPQKMRILTIEDTLELPVQQLNRAGFKTQRLKVQSAITQAETEMGAETALRAALRLGESVLVLGEVRGPETRVLYEAMRVGAAGNAVLGTIHGSSTRDVYERIVFDIGISPLSFKSTDVVVIASPVRLHGSSKSVRRVRQISEVEKSWSEKSDPDDVFDDLMLYDAKKDGLSPTGILLESRSKVILKVAKSWGISYEEAIKNIEVRGKMKELMVHYKEKHKVPDLLEIEHVERANNHFRLLIDDHHAKYKEIRYGILLKEWTKWLDGYVKYLKV